MGQAILDHELQESKVKKASMAAYGVFRWVRAVVSPDLVVSSGIVSGISSCPEKLELDGELPTAVPTPTTSPASTQGSASNANTPTSITEKSGMVHEHLTKAGIAPKCDIQHVEGDTDSKATGKQCVIS